MNEIQDRIFLLVKTKNFTSADFAEAIGVQPSNISHIMSGRNKPSLDLVMKILKKFPEIRSEWLLNGQGTMTKDYSLFSVPEGKINEIKTVKIAQQELEFEQSVDIPKIITPEKVSVQENNLGETENVNDNNEQASHVNAENKVISEEYSQLKNPEERRRDPHKISHKKIKKIVVFYEDRTFREYIPEN